MAGALDRDREAALVARARARLPARLDLAAIRDVAAQLQRVLVVNFIDLIDAKSADLLALSKAAAPTAAAAARSTAVAAATVASAAAITTPTEIARRRAFGTLGRGRRARTLVHIRRQIVSPSTS